MKLINSLPDYYKLRQVSAELDIEKDYDRIIEVHKELEDYLLKTPTCAGISAIQFGEPIRMFLIKEKGGKSTTYINPVILSSSEETNPAWEGCMSFPKMYAMVYRNTRIQVDGWGLNKNGKIYKVRVELRGFGAHVFQHEFDHLDGIEMFDVAEELETDILGEGKAGIYRVIQEGQNFPHVFDYCKSPEHTLFFNNKPAGLLNKLVGVEEK